MAFAFLRRGSICASSVEALDLLATYGVQAARARGGDPLAGSDGLGLHIDLLHGFTSHLDLDESFLYILDWRFARATRQISSGMTVGFPGSHPALPRHIEQ